MILLPEAVPDVVVSEAILSTIHLVDTKDTPACLRVFEAMQKVDLDRIVFHDVPKASPQNWLALLHNARLYTAVQDHRLLGACWIQPVARRAGLAHFCILDASMAVELGLAWVRQMREANDLDGLMGLTPAPYRHALRFIRQLGFTLLGAVPGACHLARQNRDVDGILSVLDLRR